MAKKVTSYAAGSIQKLFALPASKVVDIAVIAPKHCEDIVEAQDESPQRPKNYLENTR